jgi:GT2 family glycosyltransferase
MGKSNSMGSVSHVAVVICTHNRPATLERCLKRLQQIKSPQFSVVVADSAPTSNDTKLVAARYSADYVLSPVKGASRARNLGTRATHTDIIAYLDDDMEPHPDWLGRLLEEFADENTMAVTGPVLTLELAGACDNKLRLAMEQAPWGPHRFYIDQSSPQWFERTNFGGVGDGNFAVRRAAFDRLGGLDERLGRGTVINSCEEHYVYFRLVELGYKIAYAPHAIVFHPNSPMTQDALRNQLAEAAAYAAFVAWRHPSQSWRVGKYLAEGSLRFGRWWRLPTENQVSSLSVADKVVSGLSGLSIFFRSLRERPK